jgi:hypothetical protein
MARDGVRRSDLSGEEIASGTGAKLRVVFNDGTETHVLDVTQKEALELAAKGREAKRRNDRKADPKGGQPPPA